MRSRAARLASSLLFLVLALLVANAQGQVRERAIRGANVQKLANAIVGLMSYTVAPEPTGGGLCPSDGTPSPPRWASAGTSH